MTVGIYGIFDSATDLCLYVGLSRTIEDRWKAHIKNLKNLNHNQPDFCAWFQDHDNDPESLTFKILEECDASDETLNSLELKWFNILSPRFAGKIPSDNENWTHSEESRLSIAEGVRRSRSNFTGLNKKPESFCLECSKFHYSSFSLCSDCRKLKLELARDEEWRDLLISLYVDSQKTFREIKNEYGIHPRHISKILKDANVEIRGSAPRSTLHSIETKKKISIAKIRFSDEKAFYSNCESCSERFRSPKHKGRKFCSRTCYIKGPRVEIVQRNLSRAFFVECKNCNESFRTKASRPNKFCSRECYVLSAAKV